MHVGHLLQEPSGDRREAIHAALHRRELHPRRRYHGPVRESSPRTAGHGGLARAPQCSLPAQPRPLHHRQYRGIYVTNWLAPDHPPPADNLP